jgi:integrase
VALIMGIMGACRTSEIHAIKVNDIVDINKTMLVTIPVTKTKSVRKFTITGKFYNVVQKYINLRPPNVSTDSLFLNYQKGKCTCQNIGVNKISKMGKEIANYLKLPEAEKYTGHSFRRSSATILVDAGADITALKRHGGWKSTTVAEGYIDTSMKNKMDSANKIINAVQASSSSVGNTTENKEITNTNVDVKSLPFTIVNYGTVNVYVHNKT